MRKINYSLIVSDFDGTLVRDDGELSQKNKNAISDFVKAGGKFAISTGRMPSGILSRARELGLQGFVCCGQGSTIVEIDSGEVVQSKGIDRTTAVRICEKMQSLGLHIHVYYVWDYYSNMDDKWLKDYERVVREKAKLVLDMPISGFVKSKGEEPCKILAIVDPEQAPNIMSELEKENYVGCTVTRSASFLVELCNKNYSKGTSVAFLAQKYEIPMDKTIAVGDQMNDVSMIQTAGLGVAVKNADEILKKSADLVLDYTNEEDAIAQLIDKYAYEEDKI